MMEAKQTQSWIVNESLRITYRRLTADEHKAVRALGGPFECAGLVRLDLRGEELWGSMFGEAASPAGLQIDRIVYPSYQDAVRADAALCQGESATAASIDREIAEYRAEMDRLAEIERSASAEGGAS